MSNSIVITIYLHLSLKWQQQHTKTSQFFLMDARNQWSGTGQSCCIAVFLGGYSKQILSESIRYSDTNGKIRELNSQHCWFSMPNKMATPNKLVFQKQLGVVIQLKVNNYGRDIFIAVLDLNSNICRNTMPKVDFGPTLH